MNHPAVALISPTLLLELDQAFRSALELDSLLSPILKQARDVVNAESGSIWLLNEAGTELKCAQVIGPKAAEMSKAVMRAKKFVSAYRSVTGGKMDMGELAHTQWMDIRTFKNYFDVPARNIIIAPLVARSELMGVMLFNKTGRPAFKRTDRNFIIGLSRRIAVAIQNTQLYERQNRTTERQKLLNQISSHLHQTLDIDELIPRIFAEVNKAINAEAQSIWLVDEKEGNIKCRFATGPSAERLKGFSVPLSAPSIVGASVLKQESIIIKDAQNDPRHASAADESTGFVTRSLMTVPLVLEDKSIGAIQAVNKHDRQLFSQDDLDLFRSIADSAVLAVNNAQLVANLQNSYDLTLDALSAALDLRDRETEGHSRRVVEYTARIAKQMGLDKEAIKTIRRGALIHDIGKIGVPDAVLLKPAELNEEERKIIERHPQAGYDMLAGIPYLQEEIKIVICHQEKWDGTGYPFGLRGGEIILGARLFAIADTFDALTSDRPYRKSRSHETARKIIGDESGRQFDPQAVAAFLAVPADEWIQIRAQVMDEIARRHSLKKMSSIL
ncbi:MAG TPA: HD domain-containing phosphohydrolase [Anaerolineales bacterium]|nr:HD domain-containing phosphohydrolase [Anaerolineales bacterium]